MRIRLAAVPLLFLVITTSPAHPQTAPIQVPPDLSITPNSPPQPIGSMAISANGQVLATATVAGSGGSAASTITVWDMREGRGVSLRQPSSLGAVTKLALSHGGLRLAAGQQDGSVALFGAELADHERILKEHPAAITALAFSGDFKWLAAGDAQGGLLLWETKGWNVDKILRGQYPNMPLRDVVFSPASAVVAALSWQAWAQAPTRRAAVFGWGLTERNRSQGQLIINPVSGAQIMLLQGMSWRMDPGLDPVALAYSPVSSDGRVAVAGGAEDPTIRLATFGNVRELRGHRGGTDSLAFTPDGKWLISGGRDNLVRVWNAVEATDPLELHGHGREVVSVGVGPEGRWIASASLDGTLRIWDPASGKLIATLYSFPDDQWLVLAPNGLFDGTASERFSVRKTASPTTLPLHALSATHHHPGLLKRLLAGGTPEPAARSDLNPIALRLTQIPIPAATKGPPSLNLKVEVSGPATEARLYRNGTAVATLARPKTARADPWSATARVVLSRGENQLIARAAAPDGVGFASAPIRIEGPSAGAATAYIVVVGPGAYPDVVTGKRTASADAKAFGEALQKSLSGSGAFERVVVIPLLENDATRAKLEATLALLAKPAPRPSRLPPAIPSAAPSNPGPAGPDDVVFLYFAGVGASDGDRYYLLFPDAGAVQAPAPGTSSSSAMSDRDLLNAFSKVDAGPLVLILDIAISAKGERLPPMESRALLRLARDTGLVLLTGGQGIGSFNYAGRYLTIALLHVLEKGAPELDSLDTKLSLKEWFRQVALLVPLMQRRDMSARNELALVDGEQELRPARRGHLAPRVIYGTGKFAEDMVVGNNAAPEEIPKKAP